MVCGTKGRRFESCRVHQLEIKPLDRGFFVTNLTVGEAKVRDLSANKPNRPYTGCMQPNIQNAIGILQKIKDELGPSYVAYWSLPNSILTLCGARAYCDGVFWDEDNKGLLEGWQAEINRTLEVIKAGGNLLWSRSDITKVHPDEHYAGYDCTFEPGLRYVLAQTKLLTHTTFEDLAGNYDEISISQTFVADLKQQPAMRDYSSDDLRVAAFGLMLGYPDKAITGTIGHDKNYNAFSVRGLSANIRGAGYYNGPQPVYDYPRDLVNDPDILAHENLWSDLLYAYYTSSFHKNLEADTSYNAKIEEHHSKAR